MYDMRALNTIRKEPGSPKEKRTILTEVAKQRVSIVAILVVHVMMPLSIRFLK